MINTLLTTATMSVTEGVTLDWHIKTVWSSCFTSSHGWSVFRWTWNFIVRRCPSYSCCSASGISKPKSQRSLCFNIINNRVTRCTSPYKGLSHHTSGCFNTCWQFAVVHVSLEAVRQDVRPSTSQFDCVWRWQLLKCWFVLKITSA